MAVEKFNFFAMKFRVPKLIFRSHFTHILYNMANNPSNDDSVHHITQIDDSGDSGDECDPVEFSPSLFGGVLTQEEVEENNEEKSEDCGEDRAFDDPVSVVTPQVVKRVRAILPEEERQRRKKESAKKKRLNRKIKGLEDKVLKIGAKNQKLQKQEKDWKAELARQKRTNKVLSSCLIAAERKVEELKEELHFESEASKKIASKTSTLEAKIKKLSKEAGSEVGDITPRQMRAHLQKAEKQVNLWMRESEKLLNEKAKLERQVEALQARNEVLRAEASSKKTQADVPKMELKLEIDQLNMKREAQRIEDKIRLEREKSEMRLRQLEAKHSASIASNDAKYSHRVQEAKEKAEAAAKRRKASYFGSNLVSCRVNFVF